MPLHPLKILVVRVHIQVASLHVGHPRLNHGFGVIHAEIAHTHVADRAAGAHASRTKHAIQIGLRHGGISYGGRMRRTRKVTFQEEIEEIDDGHDAARLVGFVDADERGRVALRECEEQMRQRLVGVDDELRAERLELGSDTCR